LILGIWVSQEQMIAPKTFPGGVREGWARFRRVYLGIAGWAPKVTAIGSPMRSTTEPVGCESSDWDDLDLDWSRCADIRTDVSYTSARFDACCFHECSRETEAADSGTAVRSRKPAMVVGRARR